MRSQVRALITIAIAGLIPAVLVDASTPVVRGRTTIDCVRGAHPRLSFDWRAGRGRLIGSLRGGRLSAIRLSVPGVGAVEAMSAGRLAIHWGGGASSLGRSPTGAAVVASGGPSAMSGGAVTGRVAGGRLLLAAGRHEIDAALAHRSRRALQRTTAIAAWSRWEMGALAGIKDGATIGTIYWSLTSSSSRCELELAPWGEKRGFTARLETGAEGMAALIDLRFRIANPMAPGAAARRGDTDLEFALRRSLAGLPAILGAEINLADTRHSDFPLTLLDDPPAAAASRAWIELAIPDWVDRTRVSLKAELRRAGGVDRSRLHAAMATVPARVALDWTAGGGLLLNLRCRWDLPFELGIEAGAAAWSGPLAGTGTAIDLPHVPGQGLPARFATRGQEAGFLLDWQMAQVRVRLGLATRRSLDDVPDVRVASRVDLAWPLADRGS